MNFMGKPIEIFQMPILTPIQSRIFEELKTTRFMSRKQLVRKLNTPRTTIYDNLVKLKEKNLIQKTSKQYYSNRPIWGRPIVYWSLKEEILKQI